jgi:hypothetical protein
MRTVAGKRKPCAVVHAHDRWKTQATRSGAGACTRSLEWKATEQNGESERWNRKLKTDDVTLLMWRG